MTDYINFFKNLENVQLYHRKHGESIWGKDQEGNFHVLIHNFLNFNTTTYLGIKDKEPHEEILDAKIFEDIKKII